MLFDCFQIAQCEPDWASDCQLKLTQHEAMLPANTGIGELRVRRLKVHVGGERDVAAYWEGGDWVEGSRDIS